MINESYQEQFRENQRTNKTNKTKKNNKIAFGTKIPPRPIPNVAKKKFSRLENNIEPKNHRQTNIRLDRDRPDPVRRTEPRDSNFQNESNTNYEQRQPIRPYETPTKRFVVRNDEPTTDSNDSIRKPIRFESNNVRPSQRNDQNRAPTPRARPNRSNEASFRIERRKRQSPVPHNDEIRRETTPVERNQPHRVIRVVRNPKHQVNTYDDEYDDHQRVVHERNPRRKQIIQRATPTEYVYVDEPAPIRRHGRARQRAQVVYVDDDQETEFDDDFIYVDEDGNQVEIIEDRRYPSKDRLVEYVYDEDYETERRPRRQPKVVYLSEADRSPRRVKKIPSTRYVYE